MKDILAVEKGLSNEASEGNFLVGKRWILVNRAEVIEQQLSSSNVEVEVNVVEDT